MPVEAVKITQKQIEVTVKSTGQRLTVSSPKVLTATAGKVGPPGPAGANADAAFEWVTQTFEIVAPEQEFNLDFSPRANSVFVYLNGLLELSWTLSESSITVADILLSGDTLVINYQKES